MRRRRTASPLLPLSLIALIALLMIPPAAAEPGRDDWAGRLAAMDQALAAGDTSAALAAWREAYVAAHVSRGWQGMLAVGDAALRAGRASGIPELAEPRARRAYLTALLRARRQGSLDGVLAAGDAFERLGDRAVVRQAQAIAADLAERSGDGAARVRVQAFRAR
jgi:hypothetical protein